MEWDYARSFIGNSDILDEERREAFLQTLEELKEVQEPDEPISNELVHERDDALKRDVQDQSTLTAAAAARQPSDASIETIGGRKRSDSEADYGIDSPRRNSPTNTPKPTPPSVLKPPSKILAPKIPPPHTASSKPSAPRGRNNPTTSPRSGKGSKKGNPSLLQQAQSMVRFVQTLVKNMTGTFAENPASLLKTLAFIIALLGVLSRGEVRDRLQRAVGGSWNKLKGTVGMGVKVSYI